MLRPNPAPALPRLGLRAPLATALAAGVLVAATLLVAGLGLSVDRGIRLTGNLAAMEATTTVTHGAGGTIARVHVVEGAPVASGDLIVTLDRTELDGQIAALLARAGEARNLIAAARAETRALLDHIDEDGSDPQAHIDDLDQRVRNLQKDVVGLEARIALAELQLAQTEVRAPRPGRLVTLAAVAAGDVVGPGAVLAEIAPPDAPVLVEARISAALTGHITPGRPAKAWLTGLWRRDTAPFDARVVAVAEEAVDDRRIGLPFHHVRIALAEPRARIERRARLHPGQRIEVLVPTGARSLLAEMLDPVRRNLDPTIRRWLKEHLES